jgi:phosphotransferase system HPr (HPr) family protein
MAVDLELELRNPSGLHARPAAVFVRAAAGFRSDIRVVNLTTGSPPASAKSLLAILGLGVLRDHRVRISVAGDDEQAAATTLRDLVTSGLGEPLGA